MNKAEQQLGMKHATAMSRLRKAVLLRLVQQAHMDDCFRCGEKITTVEELSFEHKQPWLDVDPTLFWDLDNIAFSHLVCNVQAGRSNKRRHAPPGTTWCSVHKAYLPVAQFYRNRRNASGYGTCCSECFEKQRKKL